MLTIDELTRLLGGELLAGLARNTRITGVASLAGSGGPGGRSPSSPTRKYPQPRLRSVRVPPWCSCPANFRWAAVPADVARSWPWKNPSAAFAQNGGNDSPRRRCRSCPGVRSDSADWPGTCGWGRGRVGRTLRGDRGRRGEIGDRVVIGAPRVHRCGGRTVGDDSLASIRTSRSANAAGWGRRNHPASRAWSSAATGSASRRARADTSKVPADRGRADRRRRGNRREQHGGPARGSAARTSARAPRSTTSCRSLTTSSSDRTASCVRRRGFPAARGSGRHVTIAGQVGIVGHVEIGDEGDPGGKGGDQQQRGAQGGGCGGYPAEPLNEAKEKLRAHPPPAEVD